MSELAAPSWLTARAGALSRDELKRAIEYLTRIEKSKAALDGDLPDNGSKVDPAQLAAHIRAGMGMATR